MMSRVDEGRRRVRRIGIAVTLSICCVFAAGCAEPRPSAPTEVRLRRAASTLVTADAGAPAHQAPVGGRAAIRVEAPGGNIVAIDAEGHAVKLTSSGVDSKPMLSDDGRVIVFARDVHRGGGPPARDLYTVTLDGAAPELLIRDDPTVGLTGDPDMPLSGFFDWAFLPDGHRVVFSIAVGRSEEIVAIDPKTKTIRWLASSFGYQHLVIRSGPNRGRLLVMEHAYLPSGGGTVELCWLVDGSTGAKLREVSECDDVKGFDNADVHRALGF